MITHLNRFLTLFIVTILTACAAPQAPALPTAAPTKTTLPSPTATVTPEPTATPAPTETPLPTATPIPTKKPTHTLIPTPEKFIDGKLVLSDEAYDTFMNQAQTLNGEEQWQIFLKIALYNALLEYSLRPEQQATIYFEQGLAYESVGHYDLAIDNYLRILDLGTKTADIYNELCWVYGINNRAEEALPYCEEAVSLNPSCANLDSRGLVYGLLEKYPEAASDFEAAVQLDGYPSEEMKALRQEWVTALKAGTNPITSSMLNNERYEEVPLPGPQFEGDAKMSYVREIFEEQGYVFDESQDLVGLLGTLQQADCTAEILLIGSEQDFRGGMFLIPKCDIKTMAELGFKFSQAFAQTDTELWRATIWGLADWYDVFKNKPASDLTPTFGGFTFKVESGATMGLPGGMVISAEPAP